MTRWTRFTDWCQRPSMIKIRTFNPRNVMVLVTFSILASSIIFGTWHYQVTSAPAPQFTNVDLEGFETLIITTDTTLTEDYFGNIVIGADNVTLDGDGHLIIGPSPDNYGLDPNDARTLYPNSTALWGVTIGIHLEGRAGVTVKNCRVTDFYVGFNLYESDGNTLQGNTANTFNGFVLQNSSNNILLNNTANVYSYTDYSHGFLLGFCYGNILQANTAKGYYRGFCVDDCNGNIFFHNALINNTVQAIVFYEPEAVANTWDYGYLSGGNYWSDYTGVDANGDGIGDTPYVINTQARDARENDIDRFPLMTPTDVSDLG